MSVYVMLTVDLDSGVSDAARKKFNAYLAKENWKKLKLTTTWYASFKERATNAGAIGAAKTVVKNAAADADISNYEAAALAGDAVPTVW